MAELAGAMLSHYFADAAAMQRYVAQMRLPKRKRAQGLHGELAVWRPDEESQVILRATPEPMQFLFDLAHPFGEATMNVRYDLVTGAVGEVVVSDMNADRSAFRDVLENWIIDLEAEEIDEPADEITSLEGLVSPLGGRSASDPDADLPLEASADDARRVHTIATADARQRSRKRPGPPDATDRAWIAANPQALWPILDQYVAASIAPTRDEALIDTYRVLLVVVLEQIRMSRETGYDWATPMIEAYQARVAALGQEEALPLPDWFQLNTAMTEARIQLTPAEREAVAVIGASEGPPDMPDALRAMLETLLDEMAGSVATPFEFIEGFGETLNVMPSEMGSFLAFELGLSRHPVLREAVPLLLLDRDPMVRCSAAEAMAQTARAGTMSPVALRRAITLRSWLTEAERGPLDEAIRTARLKGIEPAQWPAAVPAIFVASPVDGAGAQSILVAASGRGKGLFAGLLLKQGVGVPDVWCDLEKSRREINATLREASLEMQAITLTQDVVATLVQHAISVGLAQGNVPGAMLLAVAEQVGGSDWKDRGLDIAVEAVRMFEALPPAMHAPEAVAASLQRSAAWAREPFAESWFEDNPTVRALLAATRRLGKPARIARLLAKAMPQTRSAWTERFVVMGMRAAGTADLVEQARAADLAVLAWALAGDRPLAEVPLMVEIARATVEAGSGQG
ncbi:MAG: hypothetical protein P4L71_22570 [Acetobacteraceae bacterium]|nr:hypothetical protein [Acetobacteraceae bacterium]